MDAFTVGAESPGSLSRTNWGGSLRLVWLAGEWIRRWFLCVSPHGGSGPLWLYSLSNSFLKIPELSSQSCSLSLPPLLCSRFPGSEHHFVWSRTMPTWSPAHPKKRKSRVVGASEKGASNSTLFSTNGHFSWCLPCSLNCARLPLSALKKLAAAWSASGWALSDGDACSCSVHNACACWFGTYLSKTWNTRLREHPLDISQFPSISNVQVIFLFSFRNYTLSFTVHPPRSWAAMQST